MSKDKIIVSERLKELHSSGYEIRDGEPDIRGWKVRTPDDVEIGKIKELLFDTISHRVRYLIISLDGKPLNLASRDIIIPIGLAELHKKDSYVLFPDMSVGHYASLPEYKKGSVTVETEKAVRKVFAPTTGVEYKDPDYDDPEEFYNNEYFNEDRMYGARPRYEENRDIDEEIDDERVSNKTVPPDRDRRI